MSLISQWGVIQNNTSYFQVLAKKPKFEDEDEKGDKKQKDEFDFEDEDDMDEDDSDSESDDEGGVDFDEGGW